MFSLPLDLKMYLRRRRRAGNGAMRVRGNCPTPFNRNSMSSGNNVFNCFVLFDRVDAGGSQRSDAALQRIAEPRARPSALELRSLRVKGGPRVSLEDFSIFLPSLAARRRKTARRRRRRPSGSAPGCASARPPGLTGTNQSRAMHSWLCGDCKQPLLETDKQAHRYF
jgi:hypothetical protein